MSRLEYFKNYPEQVKQDRGQDDWIVYANRAFPFELSGGKSVTKTYDFVQTIENKEMPKFGEFKLTVQVHTEHGVISKTTDYRLPSPELEENIYLWAERTDLR